MKSILRRIVFFAAAILLVGASSAFADTYQVSFTGTGVSGLLNLTATPHGSGTELVTAISGNVNGASVLSLIAPTVSSGYSSFTLPDGDIWIYDDLIYPTSSAFLDFGGLLFTIQGNPQPVNLFYNPPTMYGTYTGTGGSKNFPNDFVLTDVTLTVVATPEPSTLALVLAGILAIAMVLIRKSSQA
jgi:hypothetical protein